MTVINVGALYALQNFNQFWDVVNIRGDVIANDVTKDEAMLLINGVAQ